MVNSTVNKKRAYIRTFGCQMNVHDSEKMAGLLCAQGYALTESSEDADLIIFNTCSIREKAEQKFRSELGRTRSLKKEKPFVRIAVAGCIAQQKGRALLKNYPQVTYVFGPQNIGNLGSIIASEQTVTSIEENPEIAYSDFPVMRSDSVRAWVTIMYGCNNFCSYCVVPYTRGREKSRPSSNIYKEVCELAEKGFKEITLLGQNVNSYMSDTDFSGLLRKLDKIPGIERIRFITSHPRDLSDNLMQSMKDLPKVCEHIHLPLQSGSDRILKLMNRGYTYEEYRKKVDKIRAEIPGIAITTDIIAGFPGETDHEYAATVNTLTEIEYDGIYAFKFSLRSNTKAADMENHVPENIKSKRLSEILYMQDEITSKKNKKLSNTIQEVLVESAENTTTNEFSGRTRTNKTVIFQADYSCIGQLVNVEITDVMRHSLKARVINS